MSRFFLNLRILKKQIMPGIFGHDLYKTSQNIIYNNASRCFFSYFFRVFISISSIFWYPKILGCTSSCVYWASRPFLESFIAV